MPRRATLLNGMESKFIITPGPISFALKRGNTVAVSLLTDPLLPITPALHWPHSSLVRSVLCRGCATAKGNLTAGPVPSGNEGVGSPRESLGCMPSPLPAMMWLSWTPRMIIHAATLGDDGHQLYTVPSGAPSPVHPCPLLTSLLW